MGKMRMAQLKPTEYMVRFIGHEGEVIREVTEKSFLTLNQLTEQVALILEENHDLRVKTGKVDFLK